MRQRRCPPSCAQCAAVVSARPAAARGGRLRRGSRSGGRARSHAPRRRRVRSALPGGTHRRALRTHRRALHCQAPRAGVSPRLSDAKSTTMPFSADVGGSVARMDATAADTRPASREATITCAPRRHSVRDTSRPTPKLPPVTMHTCARDAGCEAHNTACCMALACAPVQSSSARPAASKSPTSCVWRGSAAYEYEGPIWFPINRQACGYISSPLLFVVSQAFRQSSKRRFGGHTRKARPR
jgi:hypothetical protein